jgi:hypothetical protein
MGTQDQISNKNLKQFREKQDPRRKYESPIHQSHNVG